MSRPEPPDANTRAWARLAGGKHILFTQDERRKYEWDEEREEWTPVGPPIGWKDPWPDRY